MSTHEMPFGAWILEFLNTTVNLQRQADCHRKFRASYGPTTEFGQEVDFLVKHNAWWPAEGKHSNHM